MATQHIKQLIKLAKVPASSPVSASAIQPISPPPSLILRPRHMPALSTLAACIIAEVFTERPPDFDMPPKWMLGPWRPSLGSAELAGRRDGGRAPPSPASGRGAPFCKSLGLDVNERGFWKPEEPCFGPQGAEVLRTSSITNVGSPRKRLWACEIANTRTSRLVFVESYVKSAYKD